MTRNGHAKANRKKNKKHLHMYNTEKVRLGNQNLNYAVLL